MIDKSVEQQIAELLKINDLHSYIRLLFVKKLKEIILSEDKINDAVQREAAFYIPNESQNIPGTNKRNPKRFSTISYADDLDIFNNESNLPKDKINNNKINLSSNITRTIKAFSDGSAYGEQNKMLSDREKILVCSVVDTATCETATEITNQLSNAPITIKCKVAPLVVNTATKLFTEQNALEFRLKDKQKGFEFNDNLISKLDELDELGKLNSIKFKLAIASLSHFNNTKKTWGNNELYNSILSNETLVTSNIKDISNKNCINLNAEINNDYKLLKLIFSPDADDIKNYNNDRDKIIEIVNSEDFKDTPARHLVTLIQNATQKTLRNHLKALEFWMNSSLELAAKKIKDLKYKYNDSGSVAEGAIYELLGNPNDDISSNLTLRAFKKESQEINGIINDKNSKIPQHEIKDRIINLHNKIDHFVKITVKKKEEEYQNSRFTDDVNDFTKTLLNTWEKICDKIRSFLPFENTITSTTNIMETIGERNYQRLSMFHTPPVKNSVVIDITPELNIQNK